MTRTSYGLPQRVLFGLNSVRWILSETVELICLTVIYDS